MTPLLAQRPRTERAFERIYQRHAGDVYRYALAVLRNQADAEDVTQTTFMNAYRAYQRGERPRATHNWLIAIAHNVCRQRFRQSQRRPTEVAFEEELAESIVDEEAVSAEDTRRALGHLAFNQRAAIVMREIEGRSYAEIAQVLDLSVSAVETLIFRARRAMREQLEGGFTCHEAELAISKQLDGRLSRAEKGKLRAHLRECEECATFARSQRAQRGAWKALAAVPLPGSLSSFFGGGGGAAVATGIAAKAAAIVAAGAVVGGVGVEGARHVHFHSAKPKPVAAPSKLGRQSAGEKVSATSAAAPLVSGIRLLVPRSSAARKSGEERAAGPNGDGMRVHGYPAQTSRPASAGPKRPHGGPGVGRGKHLAKGHAKPHGQPLAPGVVNKAPPLPPEIRKAVKEIDRTARSKPKPAPKAKPTTKAKPKLKPKLKPKPKPEKAVAKPKPQPKPVAEPMPNATPAPAAEGDAGASSGEGRHQKKR